MQEDARGSTKNLAARYTKACAEAQALCEQRSRLGQEAAVYVERHTCGVAGRIAG